MKTKTILSVCMLTVLLYACTKSDTPAPLDCMGIENGIAAEDNCQVCHESYMYQGMGVMVTVATLADTAGLEGTFILAGSPDDIAFNPNWNNCHDCCMPISTHDRGCHGWKREGNTDFNSVTETRQAEWQDSIHGIGQS